MSTYCEETNIFINGEPVADEDSICVCETCIDNWDLTTWGPDGETQTPDTPDTPDSGCGCGCTDEQPPTEENCQTDCDEPEEFDGFLENYDIKDI